MNTRLFRQKKYNPCITSQSRQDVRSALDADYLPLYQHFVETVDFRFVSRIFRAKFDMIFTEEKPFYRRLLFPDEGGDNFSILSELPGFTDGDSAVEDRRISQGVAVNLQGEQVPAGISAGIHHQAAAPFLLGVERQAGGDLSHDGNFPPAHQACCFPGLVEDVDGAAVAPLPPDNLFLFKPFDQLGNGGVAGAPTGGGPGGSG